MNYFFLFFFTISAFAQQISQVDFKTAYGKIAIYPNEKKIMGTVVYQFELLSAIDSIAIDAQNMQFSEVKLNGKKVSFYNSNKKLYLTEGYHLGSNEVRFNYESNPKQALYFVGNKDHLQIWTQGQGKYTSHWFPSFDDVNEKVIFNLDITFDNHYQVISNGELKAKIPNKDSIIWSYQMTNPMSSYLLMLAIGHFESKVQGSRSGIPLELFIQPQDQDRFESTYKYSKSIFDFLEQEIGIPFPWKVYKQIPVEDFLYAGMENTTATLFAQDYVVDEIGFNDRNYVNVNAHELAHQWFGDLVTAKSGKDHWLQEGFATYYALLAEQSLFGDDYFYWKMYQMAEQLQQATKTDTIPICNEKASSLTFYQKGAWALHVLREGVGPVKFQTAIKNYLKKYQFQNVTTDDFLSEIQLVSDYDLTNFRKRWLDNPQFEVQEALSLLKKSSFINQYFEIVERKDEPIANKETHYLSVLNSNVYFPVKEEIVFQLQDIPFDSKRKVLLAAMATHDIEVRQAIVQSLKDFPLDFKSEYDTFLEDASYATREMALKVLWSKFPNEQAQLLDKTNQWVGFNDHNLRIVWLALALRTSSYLPDKKVEWYQELLDYASPKWESMTRQNALTNLIFLNKNDENYLPFLVQGLTHHKWQFVKYTKEMIRQLLKSKNHRSYFETLWKSIPENQQIQLIKLLNEK